MEEMKNVLKGEFDRRGKAEVELEKALPILDQHAPEIAADVPGAIGSSH